MLKFIENWLYALRDEQREKKRNEQKKADSQKHHHKLNCFDELKFNNRFYCFEKRSENKMS